MLHFSELQNLLFSATINAKERMQNNQMITDLYASLYVSVYYLLFFFGLPCMIQNRLLDLNLHLDEIVDGVGIYMSL